MSCFAMVARSIAWKTAWRTFSLVSGLSAPVRPAASMPRYSMRMDSARTAWRFGIRPTESNWSGLNFQIQSARPPSSSAISVAESGTSCIMILLIAGFPFGLSE